MKTYHNIDWKNVVKDLLGKRFEVILERKSNNSLVIKYFYKIVEEAIKRNGVMTMGKKYYFQNNKGKKFCCTQKQWNYWNRKAIAEEKKKVEKWYDAMFSTSDDKKQGMGYGEWIEFILRGDCSDREHCLGFAQTKKK